MLSSTFALLSYCVTARGRPPLLVIWEGWQPVCAVHAFPFCLLRLQIDLTVSGWEHGGAAEEKLPEGAKSGAPCTCAHAHMRSRIVCNSSAASPVWCWWQTHRTQKQGKEGIKQRLSRATAASLMALAPPAVLPLCSFGRRGLGRRALAGAINWPRSHARAKARP